MLIRLIKHILPLPNLPVVGKEIVEPSAAIIMEKQEMDASIKAKEEKYKLANFRSINFSPGPSAIDLDVLREAKQFFTNYNGTAGKGIFEMGNDQTDVTKLITDASFRIAKLLNIPNNYQIFFMHADAYSQYSAIPLNICGFGNKSAMAGYVNTGYSSQQAINEANKFIKTVNICETDGTSIPDINDWKIPENCQYIHLTANEPASGLEFSMEHELDMKHISQNLPPICADFSSTLFSRPIDIETYGMIYGSTGFNVGPSGICICIVRDDLISKSRENESNLPGILSWNEFSNSEITHSLYNTPCIFQIWMMDLIIQKVYGKRFEYDMNKVMRSVMRRANTIYKIIDSNPAFYKNDIDVKCRSMMNIPFRIYDYNEERIDSVLEYKFLKEAENEWNLNYLQGDESIGGMRVSLYGGIPDDSIKSCAKFMNYFADHYTDNK